MNIIETSLMFKTSFSVLNESRILLQIPMNFNEQIHDELEIFMELYFSSCVQQIQGKSDLPYYKVRQDPVVVKRFIELYTKLLDESKLHA